VARKSDTPIRLLLADDSLTIQKVVALTFAAEDVAIEAVTDGNQAIEKARATLPDIVLADVFMPECNGYEVCAAIKSDSKLAGIPVVLLVGTFEPFDEVEASRVNCDAYLTKPFDTSELIQIVHSLVRRKGSAREGSESAIALDSHGNKPSTGDALETVAPSGELASARARESFLGSNRILDLFDFPMPPVSVTALAPAEQPSASSDVDSEPGDAQPHVIPFPGSRASQPETSPIAITDELVNMIVEKVMKRMSPDIVREIAWEVVPEMSEIMIRQYLEELKNTGR
jgi:CheY-like chemotaxis protein